MSSFPYSSPKKVTSPEHLESPIHRQGLTRLCGSPIRKAPSFESSNDWTAYVVEFLQTEEFISLCSTSTDWHAAIPALFPNLHKLSFTEHGRFPAPRDMRRLTHIDTTHCRVIKPNRSWLQDFANDRISCARLQCLLVGQLIPKTVRASLLQRCAALESLSLSGCLSVDDSVLSLVKANRLRTIDLSGCWRVSDTGISVLATNCPSLVRADFRGLRRLSEITLETVFSWPHINDLAMSMESRFFSVEAITTFIAGGMAAVENVHLEGLNLEETGWLAMLSALAARFRVANVHVRTAQSPTDSTIQPQQSPIRQFNMEGAVGVSASAIASFIAEICGCLNGVAAEPRVCTLAAVRVGHSTICEVRHTTEFNALDFTIEGHVSDAKSIEFSASASAEQIVPIVVNLIGCSEPRIMRTAVITVV